MDKITETRKPRTIWLPLTYEPKIPGVISGKIRQTIRAGYKFSEGDQVAFHGWEGKPYHSRWSFRTEYFTITNIENIWICPLGIDLESQNHGAKSCQSGNVLLWHNPVIRGIARLDGIVPPTGEGLLKVLTRLHKIPPGGFPAQIISW